MTVLTSLAIHAQLVPWATDPAPSDDAVKAGWTAFTIFLLLIVAVALLCWSFTRQLRKVNAAKEAGVFGSDEDDDVFVADLPAALSPRPR